MLHYLADLLSRLAQWLRPKAMPPALAAPPPAPGFLDAYRRQRPPTPSELLAELKGAAWACASINAAVCASFPPRLYVATRPGQPRPRCLSRPLPPAVAKRLRSTAHLEPYTRAADRLEEVADHPLLTLLQQVNPVTNSFDLWELTTLYQEVHGVAYWYLEPGPLGPPRGVWLLPSQHVTPYRDPESNNLVDYYLYRTGSREQRFRPDDLIVFRYPDPRDPYRSGLSPLRACYEQVCLTSDFAAFKKAKFDNHAVPDAIVSPEEVIGEEERDRLETQWNQRFRRGGSGRVVVAESSLRVQLLAHSLGDLAALADQRATKEEIANAFHVPLAFLTSETNLANLQAAEHQHMAKAVTPRLRRRDEKLNERLVPLFDPSGRLFLASEDPVPVNRELSAREQQLNLQYGVVTINEVRGEQGLPPVPWGDAPWLPVRWAQTNDPNRGESVKRPRRRRED
jgi:HK97 family phage portal protein